ncbi:class I SAM-dependent methyltransferase [Nocardioides plantarum]|uniref:Class I SAM-dependent methyltransferase n=1 Tax=Nocardioides plantarum TaxID=29299 RepID=A0ABV5KHG2_9ACTN|nr:class I SAM-dependent methyltransferase [Nocardioides plantarum]
MPPDDAMVDEFDTYARWTADAVAELGDDHALPAACRGSGSPAALDWLAGRMGLRRGTRLLDSGAGVGGPAEHVARGLGVVPVLAEPMEGACRAAARLFDNPVVVGDGAALPFPDGAFDAVWSLGVLCTVDDKVALLAELARVVVPGGPVGLLVFERRVEHLADQPEGNSFPTSAELAAHLERAGLVVRDETWVEDLPATPRDWTRAVEEVERVIARDHGDDEGFRVAQRQSDQVGHLMGDGLVAGRLLVVTTPV